MRSLLLVCLFFIVVQLVKAQKLEEKDVPASVKSTVTARSKGLKVAMWVFDKGENKYAAAIITEKEVFTIETDVKGKWLTTTNSLQENQLPAAVKATLQSNFFGKGFEGDNYYFIEDSIEGSYYAADLSSEDENIYVTFDKSGKLLSKEAR